MKAKTGIFLLLVLAFLFNGCEARRIKQGRLKPDEVMISQFSPQGTLNKPQDMEIIFSGPVAKTEMVGKDLDAALIKVVPELEKTCRWHEQSVVRCYLRGMAPEKLYQVEVSKALIPKESKLKLVGPRSFGFSLAALQVTGVDSKFLSFRDPPKYGISLTFNQEVDRQELEKYLKVLAPDGNKLPLTIMTWNPSEKIELETYLNGLVRFKWTYITVVIDKGLPNKSRNSTLKQAYTRKIDLPAKGALKITKSGIEQRDKLTFLQICFSSSVESEVLKSYLTLSPALEFNIEKEDYSGCSNLTGNFQPGQAYTVTIKKGLASSIDETLENDFTDTLQMTDLQPYLSMIGSGHYLPKKGALNLGFETINTEKVYLRVKKIYPNNLLFFLGASEDSYCGGYWDEETDYYNQASTDECKVNRNFEILGKQILEKDQSIRNVKNKIVTTTLPIEELVGKDRKGIYAVGVYKNKDTWYSSGFTWMIATDLGILAQKSEDSLIVMVRSLESLEPQAGVKLKLYSKNNQVLAEQTTDGQGMAKFTNLAQTFKDFIPYLIVAEKGDDFSFLSFSQAMINTSSFEVAGDRYMSTNYEAYLFPERDIYRPGETAHVAYMIRDAKLQTPATFPVTLKVTTPDNRLYKTLKSQPDELAGGEFTVPFDREVLTGMYVFALFGPEDKPIGSAEIRVEEFMPDRIKVALSADKARYLAGENINMTVKANYLFGPPVARQRATASCNIEERWVGFTRWNDFNFSNSLQKRMEPINLSIGEMELDDQGQTSFTCSVPSGLRPSSGGLSATVQSSVFEPGGGRAVTGRKMFEIDPYPVYLGVRPEFRGEPAPNDVMKYSIIATDPSGKAMPGRELKVRFYKLEWHTVLRLQDNRYQYISEKKNNLLKETKVTSGADAVQVSFSSPTYGSFAIELEDVQSSALSASEFYVWGWGYAPWAMEHPERLELALDKTEYLPGEEAKILVKAPFSGKLVVMVMTNKLLDYKEYTLSQNTATIKIPVRDEFKPNAYVVATLLRSFKNVEKFAPLRAVGVAPLKMNPSPRKLEIKISAPNKIRPNTSLEVNVEVPGGAGGRVTLAAVDEGILQLTGFATPDPLSFYYRKRGLAFDLFDIYSMILPEVVPVSPRSPFGGDIARKRLKRELAPLSVRRVKPVSLWSGVLKLDDAGKAKIKLDVPQFNGTLRIMAVAFNRDKMGGAESATIVRDPITITSSLPRFLAPGDEFVIPVTIFNGTGKKGDFTATVETQGKVKIKNKSEKVLIDKDGESTVRFNAQAVPAVGADKITIRVSGNGENSSEQTEIAIRPPYPLYSKNDVVFATEQNPASFKLPSDWVPGTQEFKISTASLPILKFAESLKYLVHYPYGCIEQTTSAVFPLLYFKDLARLAAPEMFGRGAVDYFVNEGIEKITAMNMADGRFSYWPNGGYYAWPWASIYSTHFLVEAKKAGYNVQEIILDRSLDFLWNFTNTGKVEDSYSCDSMAYALYVLSMSGRPNQNVMDWVLKNNICTGFLESRTLLAGAYAYKGDMQTANKLFPAASKLDAKTIPMGQVWYTPMRAYALTLNVLLDTAPNNPAIPGLAKLISERAKGGCWYNTQENAFALLALGKYYRGQEKADYTGTITIGNKTSVNFDPKGTSITAADWGGQQVSVKITGKGTAYISWEASGIPGTPPVMKAESSGIEIARDFLDENGQPVSLDKVPQGSIVIVRIRMRSLQGEIDNVVMADLLPAGLEIENPRLLTSARPPWIDEKSKPPQYMDIRDDRMLAFQTIYNIPAPNTPAFYYAARAVTAGTFILPPVKAEAMYDPSFRAISDPGKITIVERK